MKLLDPWHDAALIASRLTARIARLVVFIGAESWCERCRALKLVFESVALQRAEYGETWIWLDLEEHAEFLEGFIPDDLPLLMTYVGQELSGVLVGQAVTSVSITQPCSTLFGTYSHLPDIRARLMASDWAT